MLFLLLLALFLLILGCTVSMGSKNDSNTGASIPKGNDDSSGYVPEEKLPDEENSSSQTFYSWPERVSSKEIPVFNCNEHYLYTLEKENDPSKSYDNTNEIYYDGAKIDEAAEIDLITLFGENYAYSRRTARDDDEEVVFNGRALGKGTNPELWGENVAYANYSLKGSYFEIRYNSETLISGCKYIDYEVWGNNVAYMCEVNDVPTVYYNKKELGVGRIVGMHKNFLLVDKSDDSSSDYCYSLYKNGEKIDSFVKGHGLDCPGMHPSDLLGVFGDNYWLLVPTGEFSDSRGPIFDIYYNGVKMYSTDYPKAILFGDTFVYGGYRDVFVGSEKIIHIDSTDLVSEDMLFGGNYSFISDHDSFFYNGEKIDSVKPHNELEQKMFGEKYILWSGDKIYFDGKLLGGGKFGTPMILNGNYSYIARNESNPSSAYGTIILNGTEVADNVSYVSDIAMTGKNIYYGKGTVNDTLWYRNKDILGSSYGKDSSSRKMNDLAVWPYMAKDTRIGTSFSNNWDIWYSVAQDRSDDLSMTLKRGQTFTDEWLYCTNQWQ